MIYQLAALQRHLNSQIFKHSFTNQVLLEMLSNYLNFVNKTLLDVPPTYSLLEYFYELRDMMDEIVFVHRLYYFQSTYSQDLSKTYKIRSDTENFDLFYSISETLHDCGQTQFIIRSLMQESIKHLAKVIHSMLFKDPKIEVLKSTLKIDFKRNIHGDFQFEGVPKLFQKTLLPLFMAVQVLALLKQYEPEYFRILTSWESNVETSYNPTELSESIAEVVNRFEAANDRLSVALANLHVERDKAKLAAMQKRLQRLRDLKFEIENQEHDRERLRQIEIFKRVQLQHFLQQQIEEKRMKTKFEKELRLQADRNQMLDRVLKEKEDEKQRLLKEIEGIGKGVDDEIERALIKDTLEKLQLKEDEEVEVGEFEIGNEESGSEISSIKLNVLADNVMIEKDLSSNVGGSTHDIPTIKEISFTADQYPTIDPNSINLKPKDSFAELVEASFKPNLNDSMNLDDLTVALKEPMLNELQNGPNAVPQVLNTPRTKLEDSAIIEEKKLFSPSSRTEKKLRPVTEKDMDVNLKDVSKLVLSNLVQMSKVYLPEVEEENQKLQEK